MVFVSSPLHLNDMRKARADQLSLFAATRQVCELPPYWSISNDVKDVATDLYHAWAQLA